MSLDRCGASFVAAVVAVLHLLLRPARLSDLRHAARWRDDVGAGSAPQVDRADCGDHDFGDSLHFLQRAAGAFTVGNFVPCSMVSQDQP